MMDEGLGDGGAWRGQRALQFGRVERFRNQGVDQSIDGGQIEVHLAISVANEDDGAIGGEPEAGRPRWRVAREMGACREPDLGFGAAAPKVGWQATAPPPGASAEVEVG